jgi:hypothetical protein
MLILFFLSSSVAAFADVPFNATQLKLPAQETGDDFSSIYNAILAKSSPKGYFESTTAYKARLIAAFAGIFQGGISKTSTLAFQLSYDSSINSTYDADAQIATLSLPTEPDPMDDIAAGDTTPAPVNWTAPSSVCLNLSESSKLIGHASEANSLGTFFKITENHVSRTDILTQSPMPGMTSDQTSATITFRMKNADARAHLYNLAILAVGTLAAPVNWNTTTYIAPTSETPRSDTVDDKGLYVTIKSLWIYDPQSGKIYAKIPIAAPAVPQRLKTFGLTDSGCHRMRAKAQGSV